MIEDLFALEKRFRNRDQARITRGQNANELDVRRRFWPGAKEASVGLRCHRRERLTRSIPTSR